MKSLERMMKIELRDSERLKKLKKRQNNEEPKNDIKTIHGTLPDGDTYSIDMIEVDNDDLKESSKINSSIINTLRFNREHGMTKAREDDEELVTVKLLIYYLRLTIYDFPEISKKLLFGDDLTIQEKLAIRRSEQEAFKGESEKTISILKNNF